MLARRSALSSNCRIVRSQTVWHERDKEQLLTDGYSRECFDHHVPELVRDLITTYYERYQALFLQTVTYFGAGEQLRVLYPSSQHTKIIQEKLLHRDNLVTVGLNLAVCTYNQSVLWFDDADAGWRKHSFHDELFRFGAGEHCITRIAQDLHGQDNSLCFFVANS